MRKTVHLFFILFMAIFCLNLHGQELALNLQPNNFKTTENPYQLLSVDRVGPKSDISINTAFGGSSLLFKRSIPMLSLEFERRFLSQMFDEGTSPVGIGPAFGYALTSEEFLEGSVHEFYAGMNISTHLLEIVERIAKQQFEFSQYIDPYFNLMPGYYGLVSDGEFDGNYATGVNFGLKLFYKAVGLNLQVGKVDPSGLRNLLFATNNNFKVGIVFRKHAE